MADIKGCTETRGITKGTPQGGVLSPLIWNLPFNKLLTLYKTGPTNGTGFADDIGLLACGPDPPTLVSAMQAAINKAQRWGTENGLTFGAAKTVVVVFSHKRNPTKNFPKLKLNGIPLEYSKTCLLYTSPSPRDRG